MKNIGIIVNLTKPNAVTVAKRITSFFKKHKIGVLYEEALAKKLGIVQSCKSIENLVEKSDIVITLGGDGTFLRTARLIQNNPKPMVGVNLGDLGFMAEVTLDSLERDLELLIKKKYTVKTRFTLTGEVIRGKKRLFKHFALNDVVVSKMDLSRLVNIETYIDNEYITTYKADGVIVSTSTGSTAYNLSAGGPIVYPGSNVILVTPICPHTLTHRPLVVPSERTIKMKMGVTTKDVTLTFDGQVGEQLKKNDLIIVRKRKKKISMITFENTQYFDVLRRKLYWGNR